MFRVNPARRIARENPTGSTRGGFNPFGGVVKTSSEDSLLTSFCFTNYRYSFAYEDYSAILCTLKFPISAYENALSSNNNRLQNSLKSHDFVLRTEEEEANAKFSP